MVTRATRTVPPAANAADRVSGNVPVVLTVSQGQTSKAVLTRLLVRICPLGPSKRILWGNDTKLDERTRQHWEDSLVPAVDGILTSVHVNDKKVAIMSHITYEYIIHREKDFPAIR